MSASKLRIVRAITDLPPACYRLSSDGRKWKSLCEARQKLANWLALKGDPDGTRIYPGIAKMVAATGWSHGKVCYVLDDLLAIGCVLRETAKGERLKSERGTAVRRFNVEPLLRAFESIQRGEDFTHARIQDSPEIATARVQNSSEQESKIGRPGIQDTKQESKIEDQESNVWLDATVLLTDNKPTIQPKQKLAVVEWLTKYYGCHFQKPLPINRADRTEFQELADENGLEIFKRVCKRWLKERDTNNLNYVAGKLLEEYEGVLAGVRATDESKAETVAIKEYMDREAKRREAKSLEELNRIREQQERDKASMLEI